MHSVQNDKRKMADRAASMNIKDCVDYRLDDAKLESVCALESMGKYRFATH